MRKVDPKKIAIGFTEAQKRWFRERDGYRCQMHWVENGKWVQCKNTVLEVHHLVPRFFASLHYPAHFGINSMNQGVCLCPLHHVGKGLQTVNAAIVIHRDNIVAQLAYQKGDKDAYKKMFKQREWLAERGKIYWDSSWDMMLWRIIQKANGSFAQKHPYPKHRKFGLRGR